MQEALPPPACLQPILHQATLHHLYRLSAQHLATATQHHNNSNSTSYWNSCHRPRCQVDSRMASLTLALQFLSKNCDWQETTYLLVASLSSVAKSSRNTRGCPLCRGRRCQAQHIARTAEQASLTRGFFGVLSAESIRLHERTTTGLSRAFLKISRWSCVSSAHTLSNLPAPPN